LYAVSDSFIFSTKDGLTWEEEDIVGLPKGLLAYGQLRGIQIVVTKDGIYSRYADRRWEKAFDIENVQTLIIDSSVFIVANGKLYISNDGEEWSLVGDFDSLETTIANKYGSVFLIGSSKGLRTDNGSFYGGHAALATIKLEATVIASQAFGINDVQVREDGAEAVAVSSNGDYYTFDGSVWTKHTDSNLGTIHKALYVENEIWLFGFDLLKVPAKTDPIKICSGESI
jgi:hypothetical protein